MRRRANKWLRSAIVLGLVAVASANSVCEKDMEAFVQQIDGGYPFLELKGIASDWRRAKPELMRRARECESDEAFLFIVVDAIRVLRDGHLGIVETKVKPFTLPERYYPGVSFLPATKGRIAIMCAPKNLAKTLTTGTVVTKIDGVNARQFLEQRSAEAWNAGGFFSSPQRARLYEYRLALQGEKDEKHTIHYLDGDEERSVTLTSETAARGWPHAYNLPDGLKRVGRSFYYAKLANDVGYMWLRRMDASVPDGFNEAMQTHPKLRGWIVDLRGNGGGGYDPPLLDRIKSFPRPVAVLIDAGCVSAGETFARDFRQYAKARLFGSTSAGSSSSKRTWSFPSGVASLRIPVRSRWRTDGEPIEFTGIGPDVEVEAVPEELRAGKNSVILRAHEYILQEAKQTQKEPTGNASAIPQPARCVLHACIQQDPGIAGPYPGEPGILRQQPQADLGVQRPGNHERPPEFRRPQGDRFLRPRRRARDL